MPVDKKKKLRTFTRWYERNRDDYNAERRRRYREDAAYREEIKARARTYKGTKAKKRKVNDGSDGDSTAT